jgi:hypothetical protein
MPIATTLSTADPTWLLLRQRRYHVNVSTKVMAFLFLCCPSSSGTHSFLLVSSYLSSFSHLRRLHVHPRPIHLHHHPSSSSSSSSYYYTQVVCDVDDTIKSSGGIHLAGIALGGIDIQYSRGVIYPGVAEFLLQLSLGNNNNHRNNHNYTNENSGSRKNSNFKDGNITIIPLPAKVAIVTARAEELKVALEINDNSPISLKLQHAANQYFGGSTSMNMNNDNNKHNNNVVVDWGIGPVLYGSIVEWIIQDRKGLRKFTNFEQLIQQDYSQSFIRRYIYVGDTGEYDEEAGETMLREYPDFVHAVFLHVVSNHPQQQHRQQQRQSNGSIVDDDDDYEIPIPPPRLINGRPMIYFRTYVGAAVAALQLNLITKDGLKIVANAAIQQFYDLVNHNNNGERTTTPPTILSSFFPVNPLSSNSNIVYEPTLDSRLQDLQRDLDRANNLLVR